MLPAPMCQFAKQETVSFEVAGRTGLGNRPVSEKQEGRRPHA